MKKTLTFFLLALANMTLESFADELLHIAMPVEFFNPGLFFAPSVFSAVSLESLLPGFEMVTPDVVIDAENCIVTADISKAGSELTPDMDFSVHAKGRMVTIEFTYEEKADHKSLRGRRIFSSQQCFSIPPDCEAPEGDEHGAKAAVTEDGKMKFKFALKKKGESSDDDEPVGDDADDAAAEEKVAIPIVRVEEL